MHTSLSKKLLAGLLSLVMVLSLVAPSTSAQAATKYSLTDKSSVKCGVTFKYQLKGVSKNQYVKVTRNVSGEKVVYNKKELTKTTKVNGTGKTLNLYVTYGEKVANYTGKFTVKIYNKSTNKLVKTIVEKTTVKVPALEITSVEAATFETDGNVKYLKVSFSKALSSLDASEVEIRRDLDNQLFTVEKVALATNGKTATITLLGNDQAASTNYLSTLTDYTLTVSQSGVSASLGFNIPKFDMGVVKGIDKDNETITVGATKLYAKGHELDYDALLGEMVTVKYDENQNLISCAETESKVVYGTVYVYDKPNADGTYTLYNYADGNYYNTQYATVGSNYATSVYNYGAYKNSVADVAVTEAASHAFFTDAADGYLYYCKLILNPNGTIRRIVKMNGLSYANTLLVYSVKDNYVTDYTGTDRSLKDWTIVKDNKVISIADLAKNDLLYFDSTNKIAVIYNDTVTGPVTDVYTNKATIGRDVVKYAYVGSLYIDEVAAAATETNFNVMKAGGDATVCYSFEGYPRFVLGTAGAVKTTTKPYILTKALGTYTAKDVDYIYGTLTDGSETINLDIPVSQLLYVADSTTTADASSAAITMSVKASSGVGSGKATLTDGTNDVDLVAASKLADTSTVIGSLVLVKTNAKGEIVGLTIPSTANLLDDSSDFSKLPALGQTTAKLTTKNTPVYVVDDTTSAGNVSKVTATTLGAYAKELKGSVVNSYVVDGYDLVNGTADYIVVYTSDINTVSKSAVSTYKKVVVTGIDKFTNDDGVEEVAKLRAIEIGTENVVTYTAFEDATDAELKALANGCVVLLGFDVNGTIVTSDAADYNLSDLSTALTVVDPSMAFTTTTATFDGSTTVNYHSDIDHTSIVYFVDAYNTYKLISWTDLDSLVDDGTTFGDAEYVAYKGVTGVVDVLIVYEGQSDYAAAKALIDGIADNATNFEIAAISAEAATDEAAVKAALEAGIQAKVRALNTGLATATVTVNKVDSTAITATTQSGDHYDYTVTVTMDGYSKTFTTVHINTLTT